MVMPATITQIDRQDVEVDDVLLVTRPFANRVAIQVTTVHKGLTNGGVVVCGRRCLIPALVDEGRVVFSRNWTAVIALTVNTKVEEVEV